MGRPLFSYSNNLGDKNLLNCFSARIRIPLQWTGNNKLGWEKCHLGKFHLSRHKKIKRKIQSIENLTHELMSINTPKRKDKSSPFAIFSGAYYSSCVWYGENWKICFNITTNQDKDIHTPLLGRLLLLEKKKVDALTYRVFNLHLEQFYITSLVWIRTAHYILFYW